MNYTASEELLIEKAFKLKRKGKFLDSLDIIKPLARRHTNDNVINGLMAILYYQAKDYKNSEKYFNKACSLSPQSELLSLGLFHNLFYRGKFILALKEMKRFASTYKCKLYKTTAKELKSNYENFDKEERKIIDKILKTI